MVALKSTLATNISGNEESRKVAKALMDPNTMAQNLRLSNNNFGVEGVTALAEALNSKSTLKN
jgi:hypothetical protein